MTAALEGHCQRSGMLLSAADGIHRAIGLHKTGRVDFVTFLFGRHTPQHRVCDIVVAAVVTQEFAEVCFFEAEQAVSQFAFRRQSKTIAVVAEGLTDGSNESDPFSKRKPSYANPIHVYYLYMLKPNYKKQTEVFSYFWFKINC